MKIPNFKSSKSAGNWMIKLGKALRDSNVPISPYISRADNNMNFEIGYRLIECGKRIKKKYEDDSNSRVGPNDI